MNRPRHEVADSAVSGISTQSVPLFHEGSGILLGICSVYTRQDADTHRSNGDHVSNYCPKTHSYVERCDPCEVRKSEVAHDTTPKFGIAPSELVAFHI